LIYYDPKNRITGASMAPLTPPPPNENNDVMHADGFEEAVVGIAEGFAGKRLIIYSYSKCVQILMDEHGMDEDGASEFIQFNMLGAWMGEGTPMLLFEMDYKEMLKALE
jgi:hypothetical protein